MSKNPFYNNYRIALHVLEAMIIRKEWSCRIAEQEKIVDKWYSLCEKHFDSKGNYGGNY